MIVFEKACTVKISGREVNLLRDVCELARQRLKLLKDDYRPLYDSELVRNQEIENFLIEIFGGTQ
jgi:hypothetical protein